MLPFPASLTHIPLWLGSLGLGMAVLTLRRGFQQKIKSSQLLIMPLSFSFYSIHILITCAHISSYSILWWLSALLLGAWAGFYHVKTHTVLILKDTAHLVTPGDFAMVALFLTFFAIEYLLYACFGFDGYLKHSLALINTRSFLSGLFLGMLTGRCGGYYQKYRRATPP